MKHRVGLFAVITFALVGCGTPGEQAIQPLSGTARAELGQAEAQNAGSSGTVQGLTPKLPPTGPDGGPL